MPRPSTRRVMPIWLRIEEWRAGLKPGHAPNQTQLAKRIGVSDSALSDWKYGIVLPNYVHLLALHEETGIPLAELVDLLARSAKEREMPEGPGATGA